ncbi:MAG: hypothetical protein K0R76_99 [Alphaproteobacteria bacterium]|jgi:hypothetical protein|nr:hypothetical protein [Alphaproteobacteria bacterium]
MAFIELTPRKVASDSNSKSKVRIYFSRRKNKEEKTVGYALMIRIGIDLADKIGIKPGDKVSFSYDDENKRSWLIKKTNNLAGYTLGGRSNASSFTLQLTWSLFEPEESELNIRYVVSDIYQGGIKIDARLPE